jgi:hypothetical protein
MKSLLLICAGLLFICLIDLPIGYYTLLRIVVTIGSVAVVITEFENGLNIWVFSFGLMAILFNPLIPIYLNDKSAWMPIDIIAGILFIIKSLTIKSNKNE